MARLILDSGAVIALAAQDVEARQYVQQAVRHRDSIIIPAVVIAETTRGTPRDAQINRIIKSADSITHVTEETARMAGRLLATVGRSNVTVDALIVAEAVLGTGAAVILTGDPDDLSALAANHPRVRIYGL